MPQLDPTWFASQLFWLVVSFGLLYLLLSQFVLPPLLAIMEQRTATREGDIETAQSLKHQAEHARQEYERALADARAQTQALMTEAEAQQKQAAEKATRELDAQIAAKVAEASKKISAQKDKLITDLTPTAASLASEIVGKLMAKAPGSDLVNKALASITKRSA